MEVLDIERRKISWAVIASVFVLMASLSGMVGEALGGSGFQDTETWHLGEGNMTAPSPGSVGGSSVTSGSAKLWAVANTQDIYPDYLYQKPSWGYVRDFGSTDPFFVDKLTIGAYEDNPNGLEYSLWYGNDQYSDGFVPPGEGPMIQFPRDTAFTLNLMRYNDNSVWLFCREFNAILVCDFFEEPYSSVNTHDDTQEILFEMPDFAIVRDTGDGTKTTTLEVYASGWWDVEYSVWYSGYYLNDWVPGQQVEEFEIPDGTSFMVNIARPIAHEVGWIYCKKSGSYVTCNHIQGGTSTYTGDTTIEKIFGLPETSYIDDTGVYLQMRIVSTWGATIRWARWYRNIYTSGETSTSEVVDYPHYRAITLSIYSGSGMGWIFCKENDHRLVCSYIGVTDVINVNEHLNWRNIDSDVEQVDSDYHMSIDQAVMFDIGDSTRFWDMSPNSHGTGDYFVSVYCESPPLGIGRLRLWYDGIDYGTNACPAAYQWVSWLVAPPPPGVPVPVEIRSEQVTETQYVEITNDLMENAAIRTGFVEDFPDPINRYRLDDVSWWQLDSNEAQVPPGQLVSGHVGIYNHAVMTDDGDNGFGNPDFSIEANYELHVYCRALTADSALQVYIDGSPQEPSAVIPHDHWLWVAFYLDTIAEGSHEVRVYLVDLSPTPGDIAMGGWRYSL